MKDQIQSNIGRVINESFFDSATDEQKVRALNIIIDRELEKTENEVDMELINSCMDTIENIHGGVRKRSNKELKENLNRIISSESESHHSMFRFRRFARVACVMLIMTVILGMTVTVMARMSGYGNTFEWISNHAAEILGWNTGSYERDGITLVVGDESRYYDSIEELLQNEHLDMMYPTTLPAGVILKSVVKTTYGEDQFDLAYIFSTNSVGISVYNYDLSLHDIETDDVIYSNGYKFGITKGPNDSYQANCITEKYAYTIICYDHDDLMTIIKSMKE